MRWLGGPVSQLFGELNGRAPRRGRPWRAPRLIVLARGAAEERALEACKTVDWVVHGPGDGYSECEIHEYCYTDCDAVVMS